MNDLMLTELSRRSKTDEDVFKESLESLNLDELHKLSFAIDPSSRTSSVSELRDKILQADASGRELAHENNVLDKIAFLPALAAGAARLAPLASKAVGSLGGAKGIIGGVAKDMAIGSAANKVMGALKPAAPAASAAGEIAGGFKYAFASNLLQKAVGYTVRNPGTALTAAGALGGAMMAPRDPQTGEKHYLRGALIGGVGAAGVNAVSNGALANRMRSSVLNRNNPLLGQKARGYLMDSAAVTKGKAPISNSLKSKQTQYGKIAPATPASAENIPDMTAHVTPPPPSLGQQAIGSMPRPTTPEWAAAHQGMQQMRERQDILSSLRPETSLPPPPSGKIRAYGGGAPGVMKLANQQPLTYDPATKTFARQPIAQSFGQNPTPPAAFTPRAQ